MASKPFAVVRHVCTKPFRPPPPNTEPPTSSAVLLPVDVAPTKWTPPDSPPTRDSKGPANAHDTARISRELPEQNRPTWARHSSSVPETFRDRKSTRLNPSHLGISYAVFRF